MYWALTQSDKHSCQVDVSLMSHLTHIEMYLTGLLALFTKYITEKRVRTIHKAKISTSY